MSETNKASVKNSAEFTSNRLAQYQDLTETEQTIIALLSVVYEPMNRTRIVHCLKRFGLQHGITPSIVKPILDRLATRDFVVWNTMGQTVQCHPLLMEPVFRFLYRTNRLPAFAKVVEEEFHKAMPMYGMIMFTGYGHALRELRLALFIDVDEEKVSRLLADCVKQFRLQFLNEHPFELIFARPFTGEILTDFPPTLLFNILEAILTARCKRLEDMTDLLEFLGDYCRKPERCFTGLGVLYCTQLLLRGDTASVVTNISRIEDPELRAGLTGWLSFLYGDNDQALASFTEGLSLARKRTGKRKVFYQSIVGVFHLLALLKSGDHGRFAEALSYIEVMQKDPGHPWAETGGVLKKIFLVQLGRLNDADAISLAPFAASDNHLVRLLSFLVRYWLDNKDARAAVDALATIKKKAIAGNYPWFRAEASLLLARLGSEPGENEETGLTIHGALNTQTMVDLVRQQEPWERTLQAMIDLSLSLLPSEALKATEKSGQERLTWLINYYTKHHYCTVSPRLQRLGKKGDWSGGRPMALKTLATEADTMDFLTDQDRRVIAAIESRWESGSFGYYGRKLVYEFNKDQAVQALVGHPHVFREDAPSVRMELTRGEPELLVERDIRQIRLSLSPMFSEESQQVAIVQESPNRLRIVRFSEAHKRLASLLKNGLRLPARSEPLVRQAVTAISPLITVQSDIGGVSDQTEEISADAVPHVHLLPYGKGLRVEFLVRPLSVGGPYYRPGAGGENVFAEVEGRRLKARRDLALEKRLAAEAREQCPTLKDLAGLDDECLTEDPEACLDLLLELHVLGSRVIVEWPQGEKFRIRKEVSFRNLALNISRAQDWFQVDGELGVDEALVLSLKELLELSETAAVGRFIRLDENTFIALTKEFRKRLEELRDYSEAHRQGLRFNPFAAPALLDLAEAAGNCQSDQHWQAHIGRLKELVSPEAPSTLQAELRDYQAAGFRWLAQLSHWGMGACLADDMGLGKTVQALAAILLRAADGPTLVVAPVSVLMNWQEEALRFAPTLNVLVFGPGNRAEMLARLQPFDLVLVSYGLLHIEADLLAEVHWQTVVLDEAQAIKNVATKRSVAAMKLVAGFRIITTGTPIENHLGELWNLFQFILPGLLGSYERFQARFAIPIERDRNDAARVRLKKLIRPFILRRMKSQVLQELPPRTEILLQVEMTPEEAALYEAQRQLALDRLAAAEDNNKGRQHLMILAEIMRLRRLCCNPRLVLPDTAIPGSKLRAFGEVLDDILENRHKVLVFSQFVDHLYIITDFLKDRNISFQYLDGSTPVAERERGIRAFQAGSGDVFCISLKAGGTGLNLTAADYVIHLDPWWNPAVEDQASDRAHRIGQQRPVTVYRLIMKHTIEERIVLLHARKRDLASGLLEGSDLTGRITADDLLRLIQED